MDLLEATKVQLISKSKAADKYQGTRLTRYDKRTKSRIASSVKEYNNIDMQKFFKEDELSLSIKVHGETDDYLVKLTFKNILVLIQKEIKTSHASKLELKHIIKAVTKALNSEDILTSCSCPDYKYRIAYYATKNGYSSGPAETRPSNITNPNDTKGTGCKHIMLVLANASWVMKLAICIKNYVDYIQNHYEKLYADIIYPKLYDKEYQDDVQLSLDDSDLDDSDIINKANDEKVQSSRFKRGNTQGVRFASNNKNDNQMTLDEE